MAIKIQSGLLLESVTFVREKTPVLTDVSLEIKQGKFFCLLGRSGSGKTTLLRIISGLLSPSGGKIEIGGVNQAGIPPYRRDIGFIFQDPAALFPHLSVFENVAFPFRVGRDRPGREDLTALVNRAMEAVGLSALSSRFPKQLSGGEKQRVALARALVYEPAILLLDEPLASLDNISKEHLLRYISDLHRASQATYIYVTHDEREAFRLADQIGILGDGKLQQIGTPSVLINNPLSASIAKLTGAWNLLPLNCDLQSKTIVLPQNALPSTLPLLVDHAINDQVLLGFPILSVKFANGTAPSPDHWLSLSGVVQDSYVQNQAIVVLVRVQSTLIKVQCGLGENIPDLNEKVTCWIKRETIKQYIE